MSTDGFHHDGRPAKSDPIRAHDLKDTSTPIEAVTWNLAGPNNNPFEFWTTLGGSAGAAYHGLMRGVESVVASSSSPDAATVAAVFTDAMCDQLLADLAAQGLPGLDAIARLWREDYRLRPAVAGFLRDSAVGAKRLVSMPDRVTGAVLCAGGAVRPRPSAAGLYEGHIASMEEWCVARPSRKRHTTSVKTHMASVDTSRL
jgi:hypothetical protein